MDYAALKTEIEARPKSTDAEIVAALTARTIAVRKPAPVAYLVQKFDNFMSPSSHATMPGLPVWELVEAYRGLALPNLKGVASRAAIRLRDSRSDYPPVHIDAPAFQTQLAIMVSEAILTQAQADELNSLGDDAPTARCEQIGCADLADMDAASALYHVNAARTGEF